MKKVSWTVRCQTIVATDDEEEAREQVLALFDQRPWGDAGKCMMTLEQAEITTVGDTQA